MYGVIPVSQQRFEPVILNSDLPKKIFLRESPPFRPLQIEDSANSASTTSCQLSAHCIPPMALVECMATCHSLTRVDGRLVGDPLDVKMFESLCACELEEPGEDVGRYHQLAPSIVRIQPRTSNGQQDVVIPISDVVSPFLSLKDTKSSEYYHLGYVFLIKMISKTNP